MMQSLLVFVLLLGITSTPAYLEGAAWPLVDQDMSTMAFITNRDGNDVVVIDTKTNQPITRFVCGPWCNPHMSMLTHDGKKLLVPGTKRNELMIFDVTTGELTAQLAVGMSPEHFDVSPDSKLAYIANFEGETVSAIDLTRNVEVTRIGGFSEPHGVSFLPDGSKAYIANFGAHEVGVVDTNTHQLIKRIAVGSAYKVAALNPDRYLTEIKGLANVTLTPDGRFGYAADGDSGEVAVIDTATDRVVATVLVGKEPWRAYSSPDGKLMLVPNNGEGTISVISTESNKVMATLRCGGGMTGVNFVNGGKKAYAISNEEGAVYVYDMTGFKESKRLKIGSQIQLETASTTPDGSKVYLTCSTTNSVYVIDGSTDKVSTIPNVGQSPWAVTILGGYNYCH